MASHPVGGQETATRSLPALEFSFGNPGARSLGMGGAFLGLADDASAAEANPAGLTLLAEPEISFELRDASDSQSIAIRGTFPDIETARSSTRTPASQIAYASGVLPFQRVTVAAYYHRVVSFRVSNFFAEPVVFSVGPGGPITADECRTIGASCATSFLPAESAALSGDLETFGVAAAKRFGAFSAGASLRLMTYSQSGRILPLDTTGRALGTFSQLADGTDLSYSVGLKWKATEGVSLGAVYKAGSQFDAPVFFQPTGSPERILLADVQRDFPSVAGIGLSVRPATSLTFNVDAIRIGYEKFGRSILRALTDDDPDNYRLDDGTEIRFGGEYFILTRIPIGIRGGWWRDPAHSLQYVGPVNTLRGAAAAIVYPRASAQDHYSVGIGLSWPRFQLDAAYDTSRDTDTASISMVARF